MIINYILKPRNNNENKNEKPPKNPKTPKTLPRPTLVIGDFPLYILYTYMYIYKYIYNSESYKEYYIAIELCILIL